MLFARGNGYIYIINADGSDNTQLTNKGVSQNQALSPDGKRIAFESNRDGK